MPEFGFTEEQEMFRQEMRRFARRELAPLEKDGKLSEELQKADKEIKLSTLNYPEKYGGWKLDYVSTVILMEELHLAGSWLATEPFFNTFNAIDLGHLSQGVQDEIAPGLIDRTTTSGHGYTEGNSGNEQAAIQTRAVRQGDYYVINGQKTPASGCAKATYNVITAVTDPAAKHKGISMFLVPRNTPGVSGSLLPFASESVAGFGRPKLSGAPPPLRLSGGCVMSYDDVKVPVRYRLGEEGTGLDQLEYCHNWASIAVLTVAPLCQATTSMEEMIAFTEKRVHFGTPLIRNQGISFQFAEHYTYIQAARMLMYSSMCLRDQGRPHSKEVSMAKWFGIAVAERVIVECLHIGGLSHWSTQSPLAGRAMSIVGQQIIEGGTQIHKLRILRDIAPSALAPDMADRLVI